MLTHYYQGCRNENELRTKYGLLNQWELTYIGKLNIKKT